MNLAELGIGFPKNTLNQMSFRSHQNWIDKSIKYSNYTVKWHWIRSGINKQSAFIEIDDFIGVAKRQLHYSIAKTTVHFHLVEVEMSIGSIEVWKVWTKFKKSYFHCKHELFFVISVMHGSQSEEVDSIHNFDWFDKIATKNGNCRENRLFHPWN